MKKTILATGRASRRCGFGRGAGGGPFTIQLKWVTQAQFAGYYVAKEKGFYDDAGARRHDQAGRARHRAAAGDRGGGADVIVDWMPAALAAREKGVPLVNVAQIFNRSGMMLTCRKESGITTPADFKGKTLGVWFAGNEYPFLSWMAQARPARPTAPAGRQGAEPGLQRRPAAAEPGGLHLDHDLQRVLAGDRRRRAGETTWSPSIYEDQGVATLEDGLYVLELEAQGPGLRRQAGAGSSRRRPRAGPTPRRIRTRPAKIVPRPMRRAPRPRRCRLRQMENIAKLITASDDKHRLARPRRVQAHGQVLLSGTSDPVITKDPGDAAWTHAAWDKAMGK